MPSGTQLQSLIAEYDQLRRLDGYTPQLRGQRFNELIAATLRCWGIDARTSVRSKGEIDVAFVVDNKHYLVEAKWKKKPADTGQIAKLQKRVRQRLAGTLGLFVSMAGYTPEALADISDGDRLEVLLLDKVHFEAMLSGLVPPLELLGLLLSHAAFEGEAYAPLLGLIGPGEEPPTVAFGAPSWIPDGRLTRSGDAIEEVLFALPDSFQPGMTAGPDDQVIVTTEQGILAIDPREGQTWWAAPVSGCHHRALVQQDGSVLFTRGHGVGHYSEDQLAVVAGGMFGNTHLVPHPDGSVWAFAGGEADSRPGASISRLGDVLGEEVRHDLGHLEAAASSPAWVGDVDLLTVGSELVLTDTRAGKPRQRTAAKITSAGLVVIDGAVIGARDDVTLVRERLGSGQHTPVVDLAPEGSIADFCRGPAGSLYVASRYREAGSTPIVVGRIALSPPTADSTPASSTVRRTAASVRVRSSRAASSAQLSLPVFDTSQAPARATVADLFAGSGGMTTGFAYMGYAPVFAIEDHLASAATYAANFGTSTIHWSDIRHLPPNAVPHADVVVGSPPFQPANARGRGRVDDPRNALWKEFVRVVAQVRPQVFVMDAPPQFRQASDFHEFLAEFDRGSLRRYDIAYGVMFAPHFGVPQERRRLVVIGSSVGPIPMPTQHMTEAEFRTVRNAIGDVPVVSTGLDLPESAFACFGQTVRGAYRSVDLHLGRRYTDLALRRYGHIPPGGDMRDLPQELLPLHALKARDTRAANVMGRMHWDRPAPAIRTEFFAPEKGRYLHPDADRAITHREAARLQGFPDDYLWCGSKMEIARQIGNATPVQLASALATHVKPFLC
ncbi:DNA (cytosine-5-)-methyltransferase [Cryptosporangium minutisporangium]|uniref:DNA (cytosine-5-)-methyltransferase n=1 Tax=Cryptosporangium minutisporangium TaxID=113569 RepID=A0ABP6TEJ1_9ACTN